MRQMVLCIGFGLSEYEKAVLNMIKRENLILAGYTLGGIIHIIRDGFRQCPPGALWKNIFGLILRMKMLQRYCLTKNAPMIVKAMEIVERRRHLVACGINALLSKEVFDTDVLPYDSGTTR